MNVVALAGPEHGLAAQALNRLGISPEAVRQPSYLRTNFQRGVKRPLPTPAWSTQPALPRERHPDILISL